MPGDDYDYVYEVNLWENAKKEGVVPTKALDIYKDKKRALTSEATMSSDNSIALSEEEGKKSISAQDADYMAALNDRAKIEGSINPEAIEKVLEYRETKHINWRELYKDS